MGRKVVRESDRRRWGWDLGTSGFGDFRFLGLFIYGFRYLGIWGFGIWGFRDLEILRFRDLGI